MAPGDPHANAISERVNEILKVEFEVETGFKFLSKQNTPLLQQLKCIFIKEFFTRERSANKTSQVSNGKMYKTNYH